MSWLSALFSSAGETGDPRLIDIVEQSVNVVDPRLKALADYQQRLLPAAEAAWKHVCTITRNMPAPVDLTRERWSIDPMLRAVFATPDEIDQLLARSSELHDWANRPGQVAPPRLNALLVMQRREIKRLGVRHEGGAALHDVQQIVVDFDEHRLACPAATMPDMRQLIKRRALNQLYLRALDEIQTILGTREQLERQRTMLQTRLRLLQGNGGTLDETLRGEAGPRLPELRQQLDDNARELETNHATLDTLDDYLQVVEHTLANASDYIRSSPVHLHLDTMNVMVDEQDSGGNTVDLTDVTFQRATPWTVCVTPVSVAVSQLQPRQGLVDLSHAERYL